MEPENESFANWMKKNCPEAKEQSSVVENLKINKIASEELARMLETPGNVEPVRSFLDDPKTEWRHGKPDYTLANLAFLKGKCQNHVKDSLEMIVENAVKTWEMEASHKPNTSQWKTVVHEEYNVQTNGGRAFDLKEASTKGNYNVLMDHVDKCLYNADNEDFNSSHRMFQSAFQTAFPWEVLVVYAGPPDILFSWRHWGEFTGEYKGNKGDGELIEMTGFAMVSVTESLKITDLKVFYKPEDFLRRLSGQEILEGEPSKAVAEDMLALQILLNGCAKEMSGESENQKVLKDCKFEVNGEDVSNFKLKPGKINEAFAFPWIVHEVFSSFPEFSITWVQHSENVADNKETEVKKLQGFAIVKVNKYSEIESIKAFYKELDGRVKA